MFEGKALDVVRNLGLPRDIQAQVASLMGKQIAAWAPVADAPALLIIGSLLPDI